MAELVWEAEEITGEKAQSDAEISQRKRQEEPVGFLLD